jgi:phospholipid N-methyltransferase
MPTITATYSPEDNKLRIYATSRLDPDTYAKVKAAGFIWAPKQQLFVAPSWTPSRADLCEELAGQIDDEDTSLVDRAEERADRFADYSESRTQDANAAHKAVHAIADNIPLGQPILVGHHSERHARRDAAKIENGMRRAVKMWETAQYWKDRAAGAIAAAKYKERPDVRARRIKGLESDIRVYRAKFTPDPKQPPILQHRWNDPSRDDATRIPHVWCAPRGGRGGMWTPVDDLPGIEKHYSRWIAHCELRLEYERAMLQEQGATDLLKPKPRSAAAQLPLCNYAAPGGLEIENIYHRGEMLHYPQVEMTQAEYAKINADYKATRVVGNSHRVRTAMQKHTLVCVFLTDAKTHEPPAAQPKPEAEPRCIPAPYIAPAPDPIESYGIYVGRRLIKNFCTEQLANSALAEYLDGHQHYGAPSATPEVRPIPRAADYQAMRETLKAGVQIVTAPQLFPTPPELADRMVREADIQPGHSVLEPSAGTGRIIYALARAGELRDRPVTAVEINYSMADALRRSFPEMETAQADFLDVKGRQFDRILMNPPFGDAQDIKHITHALGLLAPGGKLVAVCANGPRQQERLRPLVEQYGGTWEELPADTFKESGTSVRTVLLTIDADDAPAEPDDDDESNRMDNEPEPEPTEPDATEEETEPEPVAVLTNNDPQPADFALTGESAPRHFAQMNLF